ncbi:hypothetical protein OAF43_00990 [bacterium]|nr:hypothetical protein [bacterium]
MKHLILTTIVAVLMNDGENHVTSPSLFAAILLSILLKLHRVG